MQVTRRGAKIPSSHGLPSIESNILERSFLGSCKSGRVKGFFDLVRNQIGEADFCHYRMRITENIMMGGEIFFEGKVDQSHN